MGQDAELGPHLWDCVLELLDPFFLFCFLLGRHPPLTLDQTLGLPHIYIPISWRWSRTWAILPPPLSVASSSHTAGGGKAPPGLSGRVSPGRSGTRWSGQILPLAGLKETKESGIKIRKLQNFCISSGGLSNVTHTLLLLSRRHLEMMVSRNTSWAAMMWSRSWARCTLFQSSSQEHSKTYTQWRTLTSSIKIKYQAVSVVHLWQERGAFLTAVIMGFFS